MTLLHSAKESQFLIFSSITTYIIFFSDCYGMLVFPPKIKNKRAFLIDQLVENLPTMQETLVWFLNWEAAGEEIGYQFQYSCASLMAQLVKNLLQGEKPGLDPWVGKIPWRRERLPTPVFWPWEFHELYIPWGQKESEHDWVTFTFTLKLIICWSLSPPMDGMWRKGFGGWLNLD